MDSPYTARISKSPSSPLNRVKKDYTNSPQKYTDRMTPSRSSLDFGSIVPKSPKVSDKGDKYLDMISEILPEDKPLFSFENKFQSSPSLLSLSPKPKRVLAGTTSRKILTTPIKVLDAPGIVDDFYLNLVDWGECNILAVGLAEVVYLWNATTTRVTPLTSLESEQNVTSVSWSQNGRFLAVGTTSGNIQLWDPEKLVKLHEYTSGQPIASGHEKRASSLSWNGEILASGSRDKNIYIRDTRDSKLICKYEGHKQEVCGLKWSPDGLSLASGGNDNKLNVWNPGHNTEPLWKFSDHNAAVKAIAWSPHQRGLLASGGGTADKKIRFWNTLQGSCSHSIDTGSQVCNLLWSPTVNEFVSSHGFSQNQIMVWNYQTMSPIATLIGHSLRVLYLSLSPDGQTVVSGAADETLRFWNVFPQPKSKEQYTSKLSFDIR